MTAMTGCTGGPVVESGLLVAVARFAPVLASVGEVRSRTVATLHGWAVNPRAVQVADWIVGALASNAVAASGPDADFMAVRLSASNGLVMVEVWDHDATTPPRVTYAADEGQAGRGLVLVEALSRRWSWYRARSGGKVVWAEFPGAPVPWQRTASGPRLALPVRSGPARSPAPTGRVEFSTDPAVLVRVADRLRALYSWEQPRQLDGGGPVAPVMARTEGPR